MSDPTAGERALAARISLPASAVAAARDALNRIASLPWPRAERVSLLARLARAANADVGKVLSGLALDAAPLVGLDALVPVSGLGYKRVAGLTRALSSFDVTTLTSDDVGLRDAKAAIAALRAENDALRKELDRLRAQAPVDGGDLGSSSGPAVMRIADLASSMASQIAVVDRLLRSRPSGLRLAGVDLQLKGTGTAFDGDVALDLGSPAGGSAVGISFVPGTSEVGRRPEAPVPDVSGYTTALAERKLLARGFGVMLTRVTGARGIVTGQSPPAGTSAPAGSVVRLIVREPSPLVFDPAPGDFANAVTVRITPVTPGTTIRYTTDGTDPTATTGTLYSGPITLSKTTTLKARAFTAGVNDSAVTSAVYTRTAFMATEFVGHIVATRMISGSTYNVSITMRNTGNTTWMPVGTAAVRLGPLSPEDTPRWGVARRDLATAVPPGVAVTFAFSVVAPPPGTHVFEWRMVQGVSEWFGAATQSVLVTVSAATYSVYGKNLAAGIGGNQL